MGTINYYTSDYITLGLRPYDYDDFASDNDFMEEARQRINEYGGNINDYIYDYINDCYECDRENIETELENYSFYFYHVTIKSGYYEGFSIDIENNFPVAFNDYQDKRDAQKEITEIKQFLINAAGLGLVKCSPGWCTGYSNYNETIKAIKEAVKNMRQEARHTPTWYTYKEV